MKNYTTIERIRSEAWFEWNTFIQDETVETYQNQATGIINWVVARRYNLSSMLNHPNFEGSEANNMLARVEELIWAGHLLNKDYNIQDQDSNSNGNKKIDDGYRILDDIVSWKITLIDALYDNDWNLINWTWNEFATNGSSPAGTMSWYPNTPWHVFTMDQRR